MKTMNIRVSSGVEGLDGILHGLRIGDNVVWQIDDISNYERFVSPFIAQALKEKRKVIYMRFGQHAPLVPNSKEITVYNLDAHEGFESFSREIHAIITSEGKGAFYVFDCLSDLLSAWATDLMIGNFFMVTCPYLFDMDTVAYFAIQRNRHSYKTVARIRETTQLLIDLYYCDGTCYVHPLKVWKRYSPTMFLPHVEEGGKMVPITNSVDASTLFARIFTNASENARQSLDYWDLLFMRARELLRANRTVGEQWEMIDQLCRIMMTRDKKMTALLKRFLSLDDLLSVKSRVMGTGFIGGKAVGMLLARKILQSDKDFDWEKRLEPHDSFFVGSDVFYTYIVQNGLWRLWMEQKKEERYFSAAKALRAKILAGSFQEEIQEHFRQIIEYFGQSPIIVRSSSLLEDSYGNAFAGKYESVFLANQGTPEERFTRFIDAVRKVYSSTMSQDALVYRKQRGLAQQDEQMALLVQRVSGAHHGNYFFPFCAGVGVSYNTFVWQKDADPSAGMLRIVFGLGTRAVNRVEGDYPRIVGLDAPLSKPLAGMEDAVKYSQHEVDLIDTEANDLKTVPLERVTGKSFDIPLDLVCATYVEGENRREILTFDELLKTPFTAGMRRMLKTLEETYKYPMDIEFTLNIARNGEQRINLVQCRPIQTKGLGARVDMPRNISDDDILIRSDGNFIGGNIAQPLKKIIYIDPASYAKLPEREKYAAARIIGKLNRQIEDREKTPVMLLGPGRWGTTTPSLGLPVSFHEINNMTVMGELEYAYGNLVPELSFGTHFFHDLVETGIFFMALFLEKGKAGLNTGLLRSFPDEFLKLLPNESKYKPVISVYDVSRENLILSSDVASQKLLCYRTKSIAIEE